MIRTLGGRTRDDGIALMTVLLSMVIVTAILMTALAFTLNNVQPARTDADGKTATAAAQAGINDYIAHLESDTAYWVNNGVDSTNPALGSTGQSLPTSGAKFTYKVMNTVDEIRSTGTIKLMVTGTAKNAAGVSVKKSLYATLRVNGFLNYIYMSDYEVLDPEFSGTTSCSDYYYATTTEGKNRAKSTCTSSNIVWDDGDTVTGPLHSNDALKIDGKVNFGSKQTESSWPSIKGMTSGKTWWGAANAGTLPGYIPQWAPTLKLPVSNTSLLSYVEPNMTSGPLADQHPGCYYSGPTEIVFNGDSMKIRSPLTSASNTPSRCYNVSSALRTTWQTITPIPPVIYVGAYVGSCSGTSAATYFTYPMTNESYPSGGTPSEVAWGSGGGSTINYSCGRGTVYVQGTANTSTTVAAAHDIVVTGDLKVPSLGGGTALGLIGVNAVWVYHPVNSSGGDLSGFDPANTINASVLALNHSFIVENYGKGGKLGNLNLTGALAQMYRGPVGTGSGSTGYIKKYVYDTRLKTIQPPFFIQPTESAWQIVSVAAS